MAVAGLLLAAGASRRLGSPKQLLEDATGVPLVRRAAQQLLDAGCAPVIVVIGAEAERVREALQGIAVQCVEHVDYAEGMGTSIAAGVRQLADGTALLIAACDMPGIVVEHLSALITTSEGGQRRVASAYAGNGEQGDVVRGIPAVLPRGDWRALEALTGDRGARDLLRSGDTLQVFVRAGGFDLDTPADVAEWRGGGG